MARYIKPGRLSPAVALPISALEICLACSNAWLTADKIMSSSNCASAGLMACGLILIEASVPSHLADDFDRAAAAGGLDGAGGEFGLDLLPFAAARGRLFHEFSEVGHNNYCWFKSGHRRSGL